MDGEKIQMQYEHAVFVRDNDLLRFAATARSIHAPPPMAANTVDLGSEETTHPHTPVLPEGRPTFGPATEAIQFGGPFEHIQYVHPFAFDTYFNHSIIPE